MHRPWLGYGAGVGAAEAGGSVRALAAVSLRSAPHGGRQTAHAAGFATPIDSAGAIHLQRDPVHDAAAEPSRGRQRITRRSAAGRARALEGLRGVGPAGSDRCATAYGKASGKSREELRVVSPRVTRSLERPKVNKH